MWSGPSRPHTRTCGRARSTRWCCTASRTSASTGTSSTSSGSSCSPCSTSPNESIEESRMTAHAPADVHEHAPAHEPEHTPEHGHAHHRNYVKIWAVLVMLLVV